MTTIVMDQGVVGTPHEVFLPQNAFVANFVGTPSMNMLPGTVQQGMLEDIVYNYPDSI